MSAVCREGTRWLRRAAAAALVAALLLVTTGCWDEVNLQDVSYISAFGVDYRDGEFVLYAQMLSFTSIAKTETSRSEPRQVWIGQGRGVSALQALHNMGRGAYGTLNMEHLKTIVVHERALDKISEVLDGLNRQRASRYTSLLYGTREPLESLFTTDTFFDQSPLNSLLYSPNSHERQHTYVHAIPMQELVRMFREPGRTTLLPVIDRTMAYWSYGKKPMKTQLVDGVFVFSHFRYLGFLSDRQTDGLRWVNDRFESVVLDVKEDGSIASVQVNRSKFRMSARIIGGEPQFELNVDVLGHVIELSGDMAEKEIEAAIMAKIEKQILQTYELGRRKGMDLFQLEHHLYRYHHRYWKERIKGGEWQPHDGRLKVNVRLRLTDSGKLDLSGGT